MAILSLAELRAVIDSDLSDADLERLLEWSADLIVAYLGTGAPTYDEPTAVNELISARGELLMLSRPASEILTIQEGGTTLAADRYELRSGGRIVRRLLTGTWPYNRGWRGGIDISYVPLSNVAGREIAQLALIRLELNNSPGVVSERIGDWSETFSSSQNDYLADRAAILAAINPEPVGIY